jgi:hypothetical protein
MGISARSLPSIAGSLIAIVRKCFLYRQDVAAES